MCDLRLKNNYFYSDKTNRKIVKKKLTRSDDKIIAGVCAGIAEYFGLDISLVRIGYILLSLLSVAFPGILAYIIMWIIIPDKQLTINNEQ